LTYCIDTSALLDGWERWYPPEIFPSLWKRLAALIKEGKLIAPEDVLIELKKKDDDLTKWVKAQAGLFQPLDIPTQEALREVMGSFERLVNTQKDRSTADPVVIALAKARGFAVVTGEKPSGNPSRPKIPDVCESFSIRHLNLTMLIRENGWTF
jgi:uncharacterized protein DUF4411